MAFAVQRGARHRGGTLGWPIMAGLALASALFAAGAVAASPDSPAAPVILVAGIAGFCIAVIRPLDVVCLGVLVIPLEGYFPGLVGPSQALLGLAAAGWVTRWAATRPLVLPRSPIIVAFGAVMAAQAVGLLVADEPFVVARQVVTWGALLIVSAAITLAADRDQIVRILLAAAVAGGLAGAVAVVDPQPLTGAVFLGDSFDRATGGLGSPNALGMLLAFCLPVQIAFALAGRTPVERVLGGGCATLALAGMGLAVSRAAFLGLAAAMLVLMVWPPVRRAAVVLVPLVLVLSAFGSNPATSINGNLTERLSDRGTVGKTNPRIELWKETPSMIADHPLFGVGGLEFLHQAPRYGMVTAEGTPNHAHNFVLTIAAESGVVGLAAMLGLFGAIAAALVRLSRVAVGLTAGLVVALAASFTGFFANGILDYALGAAPIAAAFFVLVGCVAGLERSFAASPPPVADAR